VVADRGGFHANHTVDGDVHSCNRMIRVDIQIDARSRDGIQLITHAEIRSAIEKGAGNVVDPTR